MDTRRQRVRECVDLWEIVIPEHPRVAWKYPEGKLVDLSLFSGFLLSSLNQALKRYDLSPLKIDDAFEAALRKIAITHDFLEVAYTFIFKIPTVKDQVVASEVDEDGDFPYILEDEVFTSNAAIITYMCNLYPILDYEDDILASFYRLDLIQSIDHLSPQGKDYIVEWLFRNHVGLKVSEFLLPSETNLRYQKTEARANLGPEGATRVACHVCTNPTVTSCRTCLTPYCSIKCQKKDWLAGHINHCK